MMFRNLFGRSNEQKPDSSLEQELQALERRAEASAQDYRAVTLNRAGDLCIQAGDVSRALAYYGRAIDDYLATGYFDAAKAMCRKMISRSPEVVRARCTLAFLSLGQDLPMVASHGVPGEARRELADYVRAAEESGQAKVAVQRLRHLAEATENHQVRELIGEHLIDLGDPQGADKVIGTVYRERNGLAEPPASSNQRDRWAEVLQAPWVELAEFGSPSDGGRAGEEKSAARPAPEHGGDRGTTPASVTARTYAS